MATLLPQLAITSAISSPLVTAAMQIRSGAPRNLAIQANFVYGSGGTSVDAYVQTSLDGGSTWIDIAQFHFTTASARKIVNLSSFTAETSQVTPTDGAMTANTAQDGVLGSQLRVKYQSAGTYAATTLQIDIGTTSLTSVP